MNGAKVGKTGKGMEVIRENKLLRTENEGCSKKLSLFIKDELLSELMDGCKYSDCTARRLNRKQEFELFT